ncbi:predicted protein, partial [Nematostella vectensis]
PTHHYTSPTIHPSITNPPLYKPSNPPSITNPALYKPSNPPLYNQPTTIQALQSTPL